MTVHCVGETRLIDQLGEKQDFECELTRQAKAHEDFTLRVFREVPDGPGAAWSHEYRVAVTHLPTRRTRIYSGGPGRDWVGQFTVELSQGAYATTPDGSASTSGKASSLRERRAY